MRGLPAGAWWSGIWGGSGEDEREEERVEGESRRRGAGAMKSGWKVDGRRARGFIPGPSEEISLDELGGVSRVERRELELVDVGGLERAEI